MDSAPTRAAMSGAPFLVVRDDSPGMACNMRFLVVDAGGNERYRGPEWTCRLRVERWSR